MKCDGCEEWLIEIDRYGERLTGCIECNRWSSNRTTFIIYLSLEEFEALRQARLIPFGLPTA
jgi:hypothetical protein